MKSITQMREEIADIMKKLGDMKAANEAENKEPTSEERRQAHDMLNRIDDLKANIELEERIQGTSETLAKPRQEPTKPDVQTTSLSEDQQRKKDRFMSFGEQLQAVIRASHPSHRMVDPRLRETRAVSGMSETVQSDGGLA